MFSSNTDSKNGIIGGQNNAINGDLNKFSTKGMVCQICGKKGHDALR